MLWLDRVLPAPRLPAGRHFAATWSIPDDFGGMTSALLHRSRAFVRLGGVDVDVLTFDGRPDYPRVEARLRAAGELIPGLRLVNLWDRLREDAVRPGPLDLDRHPLTPLPVRGTGGPADAIEERLRDGVVLSRVRRADDGVTILQTDHLRPDGSLAVSERRDVRQRGVLGGRSVVLCDADGAPVRSWGRMWSLYRWWLDRLTGSAPSFVIVDSKTLGAFLPTYRRAGVVTAHVVHSSHLAGARRPIAPLRASRADVFQHLDDIDSVVLLTERQRDDVEQLLGQHESLAVIPNSRDLDAALAAPLPRPRGRGVMLSTLTSRKRVDHAITAALAAAERCRPQAEPVPSALHDPADPGSGRHPADPGSGRHPAAVTLDIHGDGEERTALAALVPDGAVRLLGHSPTAREALATASFLLLTSRTEGFPLVLVEAMAAGCLPIAYDIAYGPADIIEHGRNGFLVPAGDTAALTDAIVELQRMPEADVLRLRRRAQATARRYTDSAVTRLWSRELTRAARRKRLQLTRRAA